MRVVGPALISLLLFCATQSKAELYFKPGEGFKDCPECPEMIAVPAGSFIMGSRVGEPGHDASEEPQHKVTIAKPFAVGRSPVTFAEWDACVKGKGCGGYTPDDNGWGRGDRPVINVSWNDAMAYISWLSRKSGRPYRLLSEPEREYVTRAGSATSFWWGAAITTDQANYNGAHDRAGSSQKAENRAKTVPVWSFQPNAWGLYQVHGNIWEWVADCWHGNYKGAPSDGSAWTGEASCSRHAVRGGAWDRIPQTLTSAYRMSFSTSYRFNAIGFRVAKSETRGVFAAARAAPAASQAQAAGPGSGGPTVSLASSPMPVERQGEVDGWTKPDDGKLVLWGWGLWQPETGSKMMVNTNLPVESMTIKTVARPDVVKVVGNPYLANSGFELTVQLDRAKPKPKIAEVCLWTEDARFGGRRLNNVALCSTH